MPANALRSNAAAARLVLRDAPPLPDTERCAKCGKRRYATRQAAERQLRSLLAVPWAALRTASAYPAHGWWHLTSGSDKEREQQHE